MKWTASVVTLTTILSGVAFSSDARAESRTVVSQNEASEADLDSPELFTQPVKVSRKKGVAVPKSKAKKNEEISLDEIALDEEPVSKTPNKSPKKPANKAVVKKVAPLDRRPASDVSDTELDFDAPKEKPIAAPVVEKRDEAVEKAIDEAIEAEKKKDYKKVIALLQPFADRLSRRGLMTLSRAGKGAGDSSLEIKTLQLSLAKNPSDYVIQTQLGEAFARLKRSEDAITAFQAAIALNKRFEPAYEGLWMELEKAREYYEARSVLSDMMKLFGDKPKFYSALCRLFSFDDYLEKATEICKAAIEKDPKHADNYVHLAVSLRDQEGAPEAQQLLA
ncbi:MAG: hypothetical protein AAB250_18775, partial [Bdellovibrionota bacterium]